MPEFGFLEYFSEFCREILVRRDVDLDCVVEYIDLGQPKSGAPQLFFGMLLLMKIIQHVCEVNCE